MLRVRGREGLWDQGTSIICVGYDRGCSLLAYLLSYQIPHLYEQVVDTKAEKEAGQRVTLAYPAGAVTQ